MKKSYSIILALVFLSLNVFSQNEKKKQWQFKTNLGFSYFEGNVEKLDTRFGIGLSRKDTIIEYASAYNFIYGELNGDKNNLVHDFRYTMDFWPLHDVSPFLGVFIFSNTFKGFKQRNSFLAGAKYRIVEDEKTKLSVSSALMYDDIIFGSTNSEVPDIKDEVWRISLRPKLKHKLSENLVFQHISFWQPTVEDLNNYIYTMDNSLDFLFQKKFSFGLDYIYYFNSQPPYNSIRKRDQKVLFSFKYQM